MAVKVTARLAEGMTPTHFSHAGELLLPNQSTILFLSSSVLYIARALPGKSPETPLQIEFLTEATVKPSLNKNSRLHLLEGDKILALGGSAFRRLNLHLFHIEPPESGPELPGEWKMEVVAPIPKPLQIFYQVSKDNHLYVFGETYMDEVQDLPCSIFVYDAHKNEWSMPNVKGVPPPERNNLLLFVYNKEICVLYPNLCSVYELRILNTETMTWREQKLKCEGESNDEPTVRTGCSINVIGNKVVIFGGSDFGVFLHDIYVLDLETFQWRSTEWNGSPPASRTDHGSLVMSDSRILFFGGNTNHVTADNHLVVADFDWDAK